MQIECFHQLDKHLAEDWQAFLLRASHQHPRQSLAFVAVEQAVGHTPLYVIGRSGGEIRAIALFSLRQRWIGWNWYTVATALSGPVCDRIEDFEPFLQQLVRQPEFRTVGRIRISPYWLLDDASALKTIYDKLGWLTAEEEDFRNTGLVDLRPDDQELLMGFSKSARREVRRAIRQNVLVRELSVIDDANELFESLKRLRIQRGLNAISETEHQAQFECIFTNPGLGVALGAYCEGNFVGGFLVYRSKDTSHGRHFTTEPEALRALSNLRIAPLLWWSGMMWAKRQGCCWLDVEGYSANATADDPNYNINKYKRELGLTPVTRISEYLYVTNFVLHAPSHFRRTAKTMIKRTMQKLPLPTRIRTYITRHSM